MNNTDLIKTTTEEILEFLSIRPKTAVSENSEGSYSLVIDGENLNFLIGYRGEALDSFQNLLNLILFKKANSWINVYVDINGYRVEKKNKLEEIAKSYIDRVRFFGKEVELPAMSPQERRLVHVFVTEYDDIKSESVGEGQSRRIVLKPIKV